ncbi:T9SS type A sorting domain-containing protein [Algibacter sp. R77976]|uniref:T9SS type A sorting domain-containing protein n=1 Tax=Algibacter sp. R77976 TaxID=3093873 RepID=UPI0037CB571E
MKKITLKPLLILLIFFGCSLLNLNAQGLIKEVSLEKQIKNSSLLIEGEVLSKKSYWDKENKNIYTLNTILVHKVFKGDVLTTIDVVTPGGVVGFNAEIVTPSLKLNINDVGVFILENNNIEIGHGSKKQYKPYSSSLGFYKYNLYRDIATNLFNKKVGITSSFYKQIMSYTKTDFVDVTNFDVEKKLSANKQSKTSLVPSGITFSPTTVSGGTQEVLTISGSGFGTVKGKVGFSDADEGGGGFYVDALDTQVLTWTDTQITVEVPSGAGTGKIRVTDSSSDAATSNGILTVSYSETNLVTNQTTSGANAGLDVAYPVRHINDNTSGGYTWQMFTGFDANTNAKASFLRAFETWRCETGINWVIGATTTTNEIADDGVNVIRFDVGDELPDNVLGRCTSHYSGCLVNGGSSIDFFVSEMDIVFNDDVDNTGSGAVETWNFGTGTTGNSEYDFESVALHELGHGHQLSHVIDSNNDVMHYSFFNGQDERVLGANNIIAAGNVQNRSTSSVVCSVLAMTDYSGACGLNVEEYDLENSISIYPNPANQQFFIKLSTGNLDKVEIYDVSGRLISQLDLTTSSSGTIPVNMAGASKGMYFVNVHSGVNYTTKKLIIE